MSLASLSTAARIPPYLFNTDHRQRVLAQLRSKATGLEKYIYLNGLKERDPNLFYEVLLGNMLEIVPILYTPTVGDACSNYSHIWRRPEGLYVTIESKGHIREVLRTWPAQQASRIAVVTDGSRILGLGDLGANGLPISIAGMDEFMHEFMEAMTEVFPQLLVQFEDFSTDNAFRYLEVFRNQYRVFNDDVCSVVLSGFFNAARLSAAAAGTPVTDQRILFFGAGSAGIGVAKQLLSFFTLQGLSVEEAKARIWTVDSKGLITADRKGLQEHKKFFARTDYDGPALTKLEDVIAHVKPTALLGLSTVRNAFTENVVRQMSSLNTRPIIFPLSNPVSLCEVDYEDAIKCTKGKHYEPGQGNNMYIFPGIGLGSILAKARHVTDSMVEQASIALAGSLTEGEKAAQLVYPRLVRIRDISCQIALAVIRAAQKDNVDENKLFRNLSDQALLEYIKAKQWQPTTLPRRTLQSGKIGRWIPLVASMLKIGRKRMPPSWRQPDGRWLIKRP
ncbi:malate dehydrogenase [Ephemerocybe angulata]|uniref:Malate dehydrogenase n=1 Tax=Ephemerocybe angulata TaxID=980116 RepID=A0A8H6I3U2_9AGAR|nr:malate dehydrogenase [Tulosesus angulatus]